MGGLKWRLKIFGPKYQEAHPNAKYGRINRSAYVAVAVDKRYTALRKNSMRVYAHWNFESSMTLRRRDNNIGSIYTVSQKNCTPKAGRHKFCYFPNTKNLKYTF